MSEKYPIIPTFFIWILIYLLYNYNRKKILYILKFEFMRKILSTLIITAIATLALAQTNQYTFSMDDSEWDKYRWSLTHLFCSVCSQIITIDSNSNFDF